MVAMTLRKGQRTRVENRVHFGMHCVGKQCLGIAMATLYNISHNLNVILCHCGLFQTLH